MNIKTIPIDDLKPYAHNPKTHPAEQVEKIAKSITEFGFLVPVLIDADNSIIAGHGRLMAARKLGLDEVPTIRVDHLTEAQIRAYRIADNRLTESSWDLELLESEMDILKDMDFDIDLTGFSEIDLGELLPSDPEPEDFDTEAAMDDESVPLVQAGELWLLGDHRLLCGDSTKSEDVGRLMDGEKADMVFTDPPYGVSYASKNKFLNKLDKGNHIQEDIENDHLSLKETGELWSKTFQAWAPSHNQYSSFYICSPQGGDLFLMMMMMMNENKHPLRHCLIWAKNNHVLGRSDYNYKHEPILYGWQHKHKFYGHGDQKFSLWNYNKPLKSDLHPTMKPVELIVNAILNSTERNMCVADYYLGSGSTLIAAEQTDRKCYGMEIDPHYCGVILDRWANYTKEDPIREDGMLWSELKAQQL